MFKPRRLLPCPLPVSLHLLASDINHHDAEVYTQSSTYAICSLQAAFPSMAKHDSQSIHLLICHGFIPAAFLHREVLLPIHCRGDTNVSSCIQLLLKKLVLLQNCKTTLLSPLPPQMTLDKPPGSPCSHTIHQTCLPRQKSSRSFLPHSHLMFLIPPASQVKCTTDLFFCTSNMD